MCIDILLLGHSGHEKRRRPCQGGGIVFPIVDIIGEASLRTIGLPAVGRPLFVVLLSTLLASTIR